MPPDDRSWFGAIPITNSRRCLNDCARENRPPHLLRQAAPRAMRRGLFVNTELGNVEESLARARTTKAIHLS